MRWRIKYRPVKPRSPFLNGKGKVERTQRTDVDEFYATVAYDSPDLPEQLQDWKHFYNWERAREALNGKTPMERFQDLSGQTPFSDEEEALYNLSQERLR